MAKEANAEKKELETVTIKMNLQKNHIKIKNDQEKTVKKPILNQDSEQKTKLERK